MEMRILLIEDNEKLNRFIKRGLEKESYAVDSVSTFKKGLSQASFGDYDCIVLDVMLPDGDGFALAKTLRDKSIESPILMLTAKGTTADKVAGFSAGADDYLTKPFEFAELLQRIKALLRRPRKIVHDELSASGIMMDTQAHKVTVEGRLVSLTAKEYMVLEFLLRHKGTVVDRSQLLDHCWGYDFDSFSNIADVYIRRVRKKLDADNHEKYIKTVRGVGYTIDA